jgi:hypothetical protein
MEWPHCLVGNYGKFALEDALWNALQGIGLSVIRNHLTLLSIGVRILKLVRSLGLFFFFTLGARGVVSLASFVVSIKNLLLKTVSSPFEQYSCSLGHVNYHAFASSNWNNHVLVQGNYERLHKFAFMIH